jgi:leader peptidase (prepilin peptidase)/N-methyltransferase
MVVAAFAVGAVVGSFLNVCIYRIPRGISVAWPPSFCPLCQHRIAPWENLPIVAYLYLRGRCRYCGQAISPRYPLVELMTAILAVAVYLRFGLSLVALRYAFLGCALLAAVFIDLDHQIIPDVVTLPALGFGVATAFLLGWCSGVESVLGAITGAASALGIAHLGSALFGQDSLGGGDLKLLAAIGAYLGWASLLGALFLSFLLALPVAIIGLCARKFSLGSKIPFGPFLAVATLVVLFWGRSLWRLYLASLR